MISSSQLTFLQPGLPLNFPPNIMSFFDALMPFVTFEYIPPDYTTVHMFTFDDERQDVYNDQLGELKYDSCNFLLNMGTLLFLLYILLCKILDCFIAWILTRTCYRKSNKVYVFHNNLRKQLFWTEILGFIIGAFIEFTMASYIAILKPIPESTFPNDEHKLMAGEVLSFWSAVLTMPIMIITVGASIWIICKDPD